MIRRNVEKEVLTYGDFLGTELKVTHYFASELNEQHAPTKGVILYFHGGGFIYGYREDLPTVYLQMLVENGYELLSFDYPLAPEVQFSDILTCVQRSLEWYIRKGSKELNKQGIPYVVMGRSAGGYLALQAGIYMMKEIPQHAPQAIISFYGFFNLNLPVFQMPSRYYRSYQPVSDQIVAGLTDNGCVVGQENDNRFLIYLASRQRGDWLDKLAVSKDSIQFYSLSLEDIQLLPPLFLASATRDPDVPVQQSRRLSQLHDRAVLHLVNANEHDFDRTDTENLGKEVYSHLIQWLDALVDKSEN